MVAEMGQHLIERLPPGSVAPFGEVTAPGQTGPGRRYARLAGAAVAGILCRAVPAAALPFPPQMRASLAGYAGTFDLIQHPVRADAQPPVGTADERSQRSRIGTDPLTGREIRFRKTCKTEQAAQIELGRLLAQAAAGRQPDSAATVAQLLDQYVSTAGCGVSDFMPGIMLDMMPGIIRS